VSSTSPIYKKKKQQQKTPHNSDTKSTMTMTLQKTFGQGTTVVLYYMFFANASIYANIYQ